MDGDLANARGTFSSFIIAFPETKRRSELGPTKIPPMVFMKPSSYLKVTAMSLIIIPGSGFIIAASEYPSMTNKEIIQYTNVLFTQAPIRVCLHGTNIDSRTILVTMYYCG